MVNEAYERWLNHPNLGPSYKEVLQHMTEKEKKVVQMKAAGFTGPEIGTACGVTTSGVYGRLYRMRKRLNRVFSAQESEVYAYT